MSPPKVITGSSRVVTVLLTVVVAPLTIKLPPTVRSLWNSPSPVKLVTVNAALVLVLS